jgi:hypothetical protein
MEKPKYRSGLLKAGLLKFTAMVLTALTIAGGTARRAAAGDAAEEAAKIAAAESTMIADSYALLLLGINAAQEWIRTAVTESNKYSLLVQRDKRIEEDYDNDHLALSAEDIVWTDWTADISALYAKLASENMFSFVPAAGLTRQAFDQMYPGYLSSPAASVIDFAAGYETRAGNAQDYAYGVLEANNSEAQGVLNSQPSIAKMDTVFRNVGYYRQLLQADTQVSTFTNQALSKLRIDLGRQIEARHTFALEERQERTDVTAAFNQAVREWKSQSPGAGY